jgi:hypothetical protein
MALGSFTHGALAELTLDDLGRMLELDETLFVEHKGDLRSEGAYNLTRGIASFANTLGGWLLVGVRDGKPIGEPGAWADPSGPPLVDVVRDRLRLEIDPLPSFEARVMPHSDGPVGVVRVYESSDTPHVAVSSGSVFVREVAGTGDAAHPKRPGSGLRGERAHHAAQIRSRAQLLELAQRGRVAAERVRALVDPVQPLPLVAEALNLHFEPVGGGRVQPRPSDGGAVVVRLVPYTLPPRFRGWATTADASGAVLRAAETLAELRGLAPNWLIPHPAGASLTIERMGDARHRDAAGGALGGMARVVVDGAGVVGAALDLEAPENERRGRMHLHEVADGLVKPVIAAAADVLRAGEVLGRCWCQIDLVRLPRALLLEQEGNRGASGWVPTSGDLTLPVEEEGLKASARKAVYAYARSAGIPAWDPPAGAE